MTEAERIAAHEAGHACAAVVLGVPVRLVDVVGGATRAGFVRHDAELITDRDTARTRMLISLCGPLEGAESWDDVPSWPLRTHASTDEANISNLADALGLDEAGYKVFTEALELTLTREYRMLHAAITGMLDHIPRIGPELVEQLKAIARDS